MFFTCDFSPNTYSEAFCRAWMLFSISDSRVLPKLTRIAPDPVKLVSEPIPGLPFMLESERRAPKGFPLLPPDQSEVNIIVENYYSEGKVLID